MLLFTLSVPHVHVHFGVVGLAAASSLDWMLVLCWYSGFLFVGLTGSSSWLEHNDAIGGLRSNFFIFFFSPPRNKKILHATNYNLKMQCSNIIAPGIKRWNKVVHSILLIS